MVLVNAVYFKSQSPGLFDKSSTCRDDFKLRDGSTQKVDLMRARDRNVCWKSEPSGLQANTCTLDYSEVLMTIILPHEGVDIEKVESQLNPEVICDVLARKKACFIDLWLPKFTLEYVAQVRQFKLPKSIFDNKITTRTVLCHVNRVEI